MSVSLLARMGHHQSSSACTPLQSSSAVAASAPPFLAPLASPLTDTSLSPVAAAAAAASNSLASFCSGSNLPHGNLSLHTSLWTTGLGARNTHRTASPSVRTDASPAFPTIDPPPPLPPPPPPLPLRRKVTVVAAADERLLPSETGGGRLLTAAGSAPAWNPFSLLPLIHGAALASGSSLASVAAGTASAVTSESALNAWSAAAAAAAAAYASLLPGGRASHAADGHGKRRGESSDFWAGNWAAKSNCCAGMDGTRAERGRCRSSGEAAQAIDSIF